ncbi:MAG: hypothetical protein ABSF00_09460 [Candidatus Bathyarchaeia archaeon]
MKIFWRIILSIGAFLLSGAGFGLLSYFNCIQFTPQSMWCGYGSGWDAPLFNTIVAMALVGVVMVTVAFAGSQLGSIEETTQKRRVAQSRILGILGKSIVIATIVSLAPLIIPIWLNDLGLHLLVSFVIGAAVGVGVAVYWLLKER